jgi:hypothetical protein
MPGPLGRIDRTSMARHHSVDRLLSPWLLLGLAVLLANDLLLKRTFSNMLTGKLSDFAGLFVFPLFWSALLPSWRGPIHVATGAAFILWKSPGAQPLIDAWNGLMPWDIGRTIDWTDLIALLVIPAAYLHAAAPRAAPFQALRRWRPAVIGAALFAFAATSARTDFHYQESYTSGAPSARLVAQIDSLGMKRFGPGGARGDSVEVWIPTDRCFNHVYARMALLPTEVGTQIRLSEVMHHCPKQRGDSVDLLRIFRHCFLARLDSAFKASAAGPDSLASYGIQVTEWGPRPRDSCVPRSQDPGSEG